MEVIFVLVGLSLIVAMVFLLLFLRSVKDDQFNDLNTPAMRILLDDTLDHEKELK